MTYSSMNHIIDNVPVLTLTGPRGRLDLSQGQCAAIAAMADMHRPGLPVTPQTITMPPTLPPANQRHPAEPIPGDAAGFEHAGGRYGDEIAAQPSGDDAADALCLKIQQLKCEGWRADLGGNSIIAAQDEAIATLRAMLAEAEIIIGGSADYRKLCADRDRLAARVAELEAEQVRVCGQRDVVQDERDKALADLAACQDERAKDLGRLGTKEDLALVRRELEAAKADLAACKDEHSKQIEFKIKECEMLYGALLRTKDELAAERERAQNAYDDGWNAAVNDPLHAAPLNAARAEADALRAELAALKGRKVKLPPIDQMQNRLAQSRYKELCADAIRAAGVEVAP